MKQDNEPCLCPDCGKPMRLAPGIDYFCETPKCMKIGRKRFERGLREYRETLAKRQLDAAAKVVAKELWHNDPDRPFTDEAWEREVKWWNAAKDPNPVADMSNCWYADKCYRVAAAVIRSVSRET